MAITEALRRGLLKVTNSERHGVRWEFTERAKEEQKSMKSRTQKKLH